MSEARTFTYQCHECGEQITAKLSDARSNMACPHCDAVGKVPMPKVGVRGDRITPKQSTSPLKAGISGSSNSPTAQPSPAAPAKKVQAAPEPVKSSISTTNDGGERSSGPKARDPGTSETSNATTDQSSGGKAHSGKPQRSSSTRPVAHLTVFIVFSIVGFLIAFSPVDFTQQPTKSEPIEEPPTPKTLVSPQPAPTPTAPPAPKSGPNLWQPSDSAAVYNRVKVIVRLMFSAESSFTEIQDLNTTMRLGELSPSLTEASNKRIAQLQRDIQENLEHSGSAFAELTDAAQTAPEMVEEAFQAALKTADDKALYRTKIIVQGLHNAIKQPKMAANNDPFVSFWDAHFEQKQ